nr:retrotransposon protein, putative, Ty1-copia subclass [Tanacetum cinerariifolium]
MMRKISRISVPTTEVYTAEKFATVKDFALLHEDKIYSESKTRYLQHEHYALWEVIEFGDSYKAPPEKTAKDKGLAGEVSSSTNKKGRTMDITAEDMQKRKTDVKARTTLLLALLDEHHRQKTKKNQLKQQYGNFKAKGPESLKQTFNRLQAIVSHLDFMDVPITQHDLNQKFLTSLAPKWLVYTIVWRNRDHLETMSLDDVYNHLKVYEPDVKKRAGSKSQNMDFISSSNNINGKSKVPTVQGASTASAQISTVSTDIDDVDIEEMDIKWNLALLSMGLIECRSPRSQDRGKRESYKNYPKVEEPARKAMIAIDGIGWDWSYMAEEDKASKNHGLVTDEEEVPTEYALMAKSSSNSDNEPMIKFVKESSCPYATKVNNTENARKPTVKYAKMYKNTSQSPRVKGNQRNWNNQKSQQLGKDFRMQNKACYNCGITYTEVSSPFEDLSDIGSPRANDHEHLKLPGMLEDPYIEVALLAPHSPDYILGPEELEHALPLPNYVPGPEHADDEIAYPEEDDDEDPEKDPVNYPADGGNDGDDEEWSLEDEDMDIKADEEEEEHPAPSDSVFVALPAADQAPYAEETRPFETDESAATPPPYLAYRMTAMISIPTLVPVPAWSDSKVARFLAMSTPLSSPLSPLSSPPPRIPFLPLPPILSPPSPVLSPTPPPSPIRSLGYRAAMIRLSDVPSSGIPPPLPISAPPLSPPLQLPSSRESSSAAAGRPAGGLRADYGFVATLDSTDIELGGYMREFETRVRRDTDEIYSRLDNEQSERQLLVQSMDASDLARGEVMSLRTTVLGLTTEIIELHAADRRRQIVTLEMQRADNRRFAEIRGLRTTDRTGDHTTGIGDSPTRTGDRLTRTGYRTTGTAGTRWRSYTARATRGGCGGGGGGSVVVIIVVVVNIGIDHQRSRSDCAACSSETMPFPLPSTTGSFLVIPESGLQMATSLTGRIWTLEQETWDLDVENKRKGIGKGKEKDKSYIPMPKNPKPYAKEHPKKDDVRHHSKEVGHCKRICHVYSDELIKKKKQVGTASSSDYEILVSKNYVLYFNSISSDGIYEINMLNLMPNIISIYNDRYFITFTDDYSRYGYVYLLKHEQEVFETFKVFKNESRKSTQKDYKGTSSDRGDKYINQEFKDYLKACGIVQQLTPPYTPQHNGVSERRNCTLLDMVRSMINLITQPLSFWDYALKTATRILNMVPTKKVDKTPYELWYRKVPNLSYVKI